MQTRIRQNPIEEWDESPSGLRRSIPKSGRNSHGANVLQKVIIATEMSELLTLNSFTRRIHELVSEHPDFEVLSEPASDRYCFRYVPNVLAERQNEPKVQGLLDCLNQKIVEAVQRNNFSQVATTEMQGRIAIGAWHHPEKISREDVDALFEVIARWGRLLTKELATPEMEVRQCLSESHSSPTEVSAI